MSVKILSVAAVAALLPVAAFAQSVPQVVAVAAQPRLDLTGIATTVIAGVFGVLGVVIPVYLQQRMKDKDAAATLATAIRNSLGAIQQAATTGVQTMTPSVALPAGTPPGILVGVQYALDHAGDEAKRLGITQEALASKVNAQIGLANIAATVTANAALPVPPVPAPAPVPAVPPSPVVANTSTAQVLAALTAASASVQ